MPKGSTARQSPWLSFNRAGRIRIEMTEPLVHLMRIEEHNRPSGPDFHRKQKTPLVSSCGFFFKYFNCGGRFSQLLAQPSKDYSILSSTITFHTTDKDRHSEWHLCRNWARCKWHDVRERALVNRYMSESGLALHVPFPTVHPKILWLFRSAKRRWLSTLYRSNYLIGHGSVASVSWACCSLEK